MTGQNSHLLEVRAEGAVGAPDPATIPTKEEAKVTAAPTAGG